MLGTMPFYKRDLKDRHGDGACWKARKEPIEFHELLTNFHTQRVIHLKKMGWLAN